MRLELSDAVVKHYDAEQTDTGLDTYTVSAYDERFGDRLNIAEFSYDNTHEEDFYRRRAEHMANALAYQINIS